MSGDREESTVVTLHVSHTVTLAGVPRGAVEVGDNFELGELEELGEVVEQQPNGIGEVVSVE